MSTVENESTMTRENRPTGLLTDLQDVGVGVSIAGGRLTWCVPLLGSGYQTSYEVQVAASPNGPGIQGWDAGRIESSVSTAVLVDGPVLLHSTPYWWRVRVWTDGPDPSEWSEPARFTTVANTQWGARAIWAPVDEEAPEVARSWALMRAEFDLPSEPVLAAFVEAVGQSPEGARQYVYKLWANGDVAGQGSVRGVAKEPRYHTHEIADLIHPGRNCLAVLAWAEEGRQFVAQLVVVLASGRRITLQTSSDWRASSGSRMLPGSSTVEGGWYRAPQENWDLQYEPVGWTEPGFDDALWSAAVVQNSPATPVPAVVNVGQSYRPASVVSETAPGVWFIDLGRAVVGGLRISVDGTAGQTIRVRLGEELEHGQVRSHLRTRNVYEEVWTLRNGLQSAEHWGHRTFRYAELTTDPPLDLAECIDIVVHRSAWHPGESSFESSHNGLDRVWELCRYTIEATSSDLYVDTPTRERGAYEGDLLIHQMSHYSVERSYALARYSGEYLSRRPTWPSEYHLMPVICAWRDYLTTGDDRQLQSDFELWEQSNFDLKISENGLICKHPGNTTDSWNADAVDWPTSCRDGFEFTEYNVVLNAFQFAAYVALERIAEATARDDARSEYAAKAVAIRAAINKLLLKSDRSGYRDGLSSDHSSQHATAYSVALGVAPNDSLVALGKTVAERGMRTSVFGAQFVLDALYATGHSEEALALLTSTDERSWLHMIDVLGATITGEAWDPALKPNMTFSHPWGTAPSNIIARQILGVEVDTPGASHVTITPHPASLAWMRGRVPTIRGPVLVDYSAKDKRLLITLPGNVSGSVILCATDFDLGTQIRAIGGGTLTVESEDAHATITGLSPGTTSIDFDFLPIPGPKDEELHPVGATDKG